MVATKFAVAARDRFMQFLFDSGTHLFSTERYVEPFHAVLPERVPDSVVKSLYRAPLHAPEAPKQSNGKRGAEQDSDFDIERRN